MSIVVTVAMLPKRKLKRVLLNPWERPMSTIARAKLPERNRARADSPYNFFEFLSLSINTEEITVAAIAVKRGFMFVRNPIAIPASETWERVSAINEYLLKTKNIPTIGATIAIIIPAINPLKTKSYWKIFNIIFIVYGFLEILLDYRSK